MLNRRMPSGMYGGVRGERKSPLLDYKPKENRFPGKAIVIFGGSAGSFMLTEMGTVKFYEAGMKVIAGRLLPEIGLLCSSGKSDALLAAGYDFVKKDDVCGWFLLYF